MDGITVQSDDHNRTVDSLAAYQLVVVLMDNQAIIGKKTFSILLGLPPAT